MTANAGTIEAQLILNASQFQKQMQAAMASAQSATKGMATGSQAVTRGMNNAAKSVQTYTNSVKGATTQATYMGKAIGGTVNQLSGMAKAINVASSSFSNMGNAYKNAIVPVSTTTQKISSALSTVGSTGVAAFGKIGNGIMAAGNALGSLTNTLVNFNVWMGALVGAAFYQFTVGAAMAVEEAKSLFKFVGMGVAEVERLDVATAKYAESASKVSQPEMLSAWRLVRLSHKMSADQMIQYNSTLGDTIGLFKANGRTAEDAGRAIEDAMAGGSDGIKRLKEIGISDMQELYDRGFDPSKPETFFAALQKLYQDKGIEGYGSKVTSLSDRFENLKEKIQLAGIAAGEALMPGMEAMVNGLTAIFEGLGPQISGAIIAFTGLTTILGFFWPTLVTIGSGASHAAGKILELAGGTLKYKTAANGAKTSSISWGDTLGGLNKRMIAAAAGVGIMVAALVGLAYYISQTQSATIAWNNAEKEKNEVVGGLKSQNESLNKSIQSLTNARAREVAAGRSTVEIDRQIADARKRVETNTINAKNAEDAWTNAQRMRADLEGLEQGKISSSKTRAAAAKEGITPEEYVKQKGTTAEYNDELMKTAELGNKISSVYDRQAGTLDKITKGTDNYSKAWKEAGKDFESYKQTYDSFAKSSENFHLAMDEGNIGNMIYFAVESGFLQADLAFREFIFGARAKFKDFGDYVQGAWGNTVAFFQGAWNNTVLWFQNGLNWISSGFSAAGAWIQGAWNNTVNFLRIMWDYAVNYVMTRWNAAVWAVTGNPLVARMWDYASGIIHNILGAWNWVKGKIETAPIIGRLIQSGGPPSIGSGSVGGGGGAFGPLSRGTKSFLNMASGFTYLPYGGIGQSISQTLSNFAGNCVDGSLAQIALANAWGIPAELIQSTWMGNPHVYARIGGQDRDIANHALTGSWRAPPRGPSGGNGGNYYDLRGATILDGKSFEKMVEKANGKIIRGC